jgi:hypothetical protein
MSMAAVESVARPRWRLQGEQGLKRESLQALFDDEIPAIRIRGFATAAECRAFAEAMKRLGTRDYNFVDDRQAELSAVKINFIGLTHYNYRHKAAAEYFAAVPDACAQQRQVLDASFDAMERFVARLRAAWPRDVRIASQPDGTAFFAGIIRDAHNGADLHADYAPFTAPALEIGRIAAQISWNLWVEHPDRGGETTIYHAPWTPERVPGRIPENYPVADALVAGAETHVYRPAVGDVIMFNPRNPHAIAPAAPGDPHSRLQIGSFAGLHPSGDIVLWS